MKPETTAKQPKMLQRIMLRLALGLLAVAVLLFSWTQFKKYITSGADTGHTITIGWIAALRQTGSGEQAVAIKPDGAVLDSPGYPDGARDRDVTWRPDGDRIYFSSDRDAQSKSLQIYRWNPAGQGTVDQRSSGKLAQERPSFQQNNPPPGDYTMLMIKAGVVVEFNPNDGSAHQRVPVESSTPTKAGEEGQGMGTQFGSNYEHLGTSFREAHWCKNRKYVVGIMHADEGETLVVICVEPGSTPGAIDDGQPHGIIKGDHIDMAVDPASGNIAYAVNGFQFINPNEVKPEMIVNGKLHKPFRNFLGLLNPDDLTASGPIAIWRIGDSPATQPDVAFAEPQVSPDGTQVAFVLGSDTKDGFTSKAIVIAPFAVGGGSAGKPIFGGNVGSPTWSPDGKQLAFIVINPDHHGDIDVMDMSSFTSKVLTLGKGDFSSPRFSPMTHP